MNTDAKIQYLNKNIKKVLATVEGDNAPVSCYIYGRIPIRILTNAISSYAKAMPGEVIALIDTSMKSTGKTGMAFTDSGLWVKEPFRQGRYYSYDSFNARDIVRSYSTDKEILKALAIIFAFGVFSETGVAEVMRVLSEIEHETYVPAGEADEAVSGQQEVPKVETYEFGQRGKGMKQKITMKDDGMIIEFSKGRGKNTSAIYYNHIEDIEWKSYYSAPAVFLIILSAVSILFWHVIGIILTCCVLFFGKSHKIIIRQCNNLQMVLLSSSRIDTMIFIHDTKVRMGIVL